MISYLKKKYIVKPFILFLASVRPQYLFQTIVASPSQPRAGSWVTSSPPVTPSPCCLSQSQSFRNTAWGWLSNLYLQLWPLLGTPAMYIHFPTCHLHLDVMVLSHLTRSHRNSQFSLNSFWQQRLPLKEGSAVISCSHRKPVPLSLNFPPAERESFSEIWLWF